MVAAGGEKSAQPHRRIPLEERALPGLRYALQQDFSSARNAASPSCAKMSAMLRPSVRTISASRSTSGISFSAASCLAYVDFPEPELQAQ